MQNKIKSEKYFNKKVGMNFHLLNKALHDEESCRLFCLRFPKDPIPSTENIINQ